jgi:histidine triad (HIT) family protein
VIPKRHATDIWDLSPEDGVAVWALTQQVAHAARDAFAPDGLNLFQANRTAGWQSVFHFHIHVVPRWTGDPLVPNWDEPQGDRQEIPDAARRLRAALRGP